MKENLSRSFLILQWLWRISLAVLLCIVQIFAQQGQQPPPEFPLGVFAHDTSEVSFNLLEEAGINYVQFGLFPDIQNQPFNFILEKEDSPLDYIAHYSKGYYNRWEAERDTFFFYETGFKHPHDNWDPNQGYRYGQKEEYLGANCWATDSALNFRVDSVLWGPNYHQDMVYSHGYYQNPSIPVEYSTKYRIALSGGSQYADTSSVCKLYIVYRYNWQYIVNNQVVDTGYITIPLVDTLLRISDFPTDSFYTFPVIYQLPEGYIPTENGKFPPEMFPPGDTVYLDDDVLTGVEFMLDWFGVGKLYIDCVELYDNLVWFDYIQNPSRVEDSVKNYALNYSYIQNLEYWYVNDEPNSIDTYLPMRIVDSLVQSVGGSPLITEIYPHWRGYLNGDEHLKQFIEMANPEKLMIDKYPFNVGDQSYTSRSGLFRHQESLQFADNAQDGFWYVAQGWGEREGCPPYLGDYCRWRLPDSLELNASVMLALAHGSKGIIYRKNK